METGFITIQSALIISTVIVHLCLWQLNLSSSCFQAQIKESMDVSWSTLQTIRQTSLKLNVDRIWHFSNSQPSELWKHAHNHPSLGVLVCWVFVRLWWTAICSPTLETMIRCSPGRGKHKATSPPEIVTKSSSCRCYQWQSFHFFCSERSQQITVSLQECKEKFSVETQF